MSQWSESFESHLPQFCEAGSHEWVQGRPGRVSCGRCGWIGTVTTGGSMTSDENIVALAEAIVARERLAIDVRAFADKVRASLPPGSEAHGWPWSK